MTLKDLAGKRQSQAAMQGVAEMIARRARLATEFKAKLASELRSAPDSTSKQALIATAVSASGEVSELAATFLAGRATPKARRSSASRAGSFSDV